MAKKEQNRFYEDGGEGLIYSTEEITKEERKRAKERFTNK